MHNTKLIVGGVEINLSIDGPENLHPYITRDMLVAFQDAVQNVVTQHAAALPVMIAAPAQPAKAPEKIEPVREIRMPRAEWPFQITP